MNSWALARRAASSTSLVAGVVPAVGDVVAHRAVEQKHVLLHDGQQVAIGAQAEVADVGAVEQNPPAGRIVKSGDQVGHRRLARAAAAHQGDHRAAGHGDVEVANDRPAFAILELDVLEADFVDHRAARRSRPACPACRSSIASTSKTRSIAASERCSSEKELTMFQTGFSSRNVYHWNAMMSPMEARPTRFR